MSKIYKIGNQYIKKEDLDRETEKILAILRGEKRTYSANKSILQYTIEKLKEEQEAIIFR